MTVVINFVKYHFKSALRTIYWIYNLSKINFGSNVNLSFPIQVEGHGFAKIDSNCTIEKNVKLGIGKNAQLVIGKNSFFEKQGTLLIGDSNVLKIGNHFKLGTHARLYVKNNWTFGDNVTIETYCSIFARESEKTGMLTIGNNSNIGDYTIMDIVDNIQIGNDVAIGPNCTIYTHDHIYTDKSKPAWKGGLISKPIIIEDGAWIGSNVTILPGVIIGKRAVVAAGSVVTKSLDPECVYGGIPAKLIKEI
ncbi:acyltransferase [Psychroserpens sp. Hel_I_66]|uniref:acyltransferase n=1 Tax=Psychroserpens sp. Hel_I_66 TaxID=1250004 RepID=UPI00068B10B8|nr:acyltransferase [Psychroserpens sp. Hel_I_66]